MVWFTGVEQDTLCVPSGRHRAHLTRGIKTKQEKAEESSGGGVSAFTGTDHVHRRTVKFRFGIEIA